MILSRKDIRRRESTVHFNADELREITVGNRFQRIIAIFNYSYKTAVLYRNYQG